MGVNAGEDFGGEKGHLFVVGVVADVADALGIPGDGPGLPVVHRSILLLVLPLDHTVENTGGRPELFGAEDGPVGQVDGILEAAHRHFPMRIRERIAGTHTGGKDGRSVHALHLGAGEKIIQDHLGGSGQIHGHVAVRIDFRRQDGAVAVQGPSVRLPELHGIFHRLSVSLFANRNEIKESGSQQLSRTRLIPLIKERASGLVAEKRTAGKRIERHEEKGEEKDRFFHGAKLGKKQNSCYL